MTSQDSSLIVTQPTDSVDAANEKLKNKQDHRCKNCDSELLGEFCHVCGQQDRHYIRSVFAVVADLMGEISHWDSRFYRTLVNLFTRPAFLTQEFVRGRHASYVPPLRLYFFISLISFLVLTSLIDFDAIRAPSEELTPAEQQQVDETLASVEAQLNRQDIVSAPTTTEEVVEKFRVSLPGATEEQEQQIEERIQELAKEPKILVKRLVSLAPQMMLIMLPFWALFLKLIYAFSGRYYLEHLSAALHTHAFLLLSLMLLTVISRGSTWATELTGSPLIEDVVDWAENILLAWMVSYMLFTQKLFYNQGWLLTILKFIICALVYAVLLSFAFVIMLFIGILTA
ncbi:DUF3667 domain-containing protein [Pseudidiomarina terrestris]|uniref:DUF3667 domain-containing protein n=1 Tax=Pseudidiomarina terrestris TaxID=2820060 RepID=A0AAW7R1E5_9GAMM|nr:MULTISPECIES: DUF3667 domain-containing protein [unclassified Pseudidiomarina]MDN7124980.1 DUF3667 domain-containing protein [Pseudidiomarina sp. 1APP75-32.1]MDN7126055.1 DUF3667 domain-containing protein [Pseudidiomarina sp. 1APR75-33.1]MDN7129545.1 DUF3667 domain-containing protein [Pseudidiomarina sp. 1APR75-15]MDN7135860.1 DUF3667 domain-containing protein [Pseudidiomarina sp. 1ASP75-5]MEA3588025.1 DUF3667 domain-containing protein [Pseudidiomarina sp. 1APP75-27a]